MRKAFTESGTETNTAVLEIKVSHSHQAIEKCIGILLLKDRERYSRSSKSKTKFYIYIYIYIYKIHEAFKNRIVYLLVINFIHSKLA